MIIFARKNYLPYIKTDMKKSILWVAAGMMTLALPFHVYFLLILDNYSEPHLDSAVFHLVVASRQIDFP